MDEENADEEEAEEEAEEEQEEEHIEAKPFEEPKVVTESCMPKLNVFPPVKAASKKISKEDSFKIVCKAALKQPEKWKKIGHLIGIIKGKECELKYFNTKY